MSWTQRLALWVVLHIPLGDLAPYVLGYVLTGRWNAARRVEPAQDRKEGA